MVAVGYVHYFLNHAPIRQNIPLKYIANISVIRTKNQEEKKIEQFQNRLGPFRTEDQD